MNSYDRCLAKIAEVDEQLITAKGYHKRDLSKYRTQLLKEKEEFKQWGKLSGKFKK